MPSQIEQRHIELMQHTNFEELKKAALGANLHGWTGFEDALNDDGYSEAVSKFIGHCRPSEILALIAQLEAAQKEIHDLKMKLSDAGCLLVEWKHRVEQSEYTANKAEAALSAAQLDATRWRALLSSPAIRILGHAGLQDDKPIDGHYCHFGMEVWSHYEPYYDNKKAGELITRYADNMIAASLVEGNADGKASDN
ncbi:hypothetical protein WFK93_07780 [Yersinia enterocolitica]